MVSGNFTKNLFWWKMHEMSRSSHKTSFFQTLPLCMGIARVNLLKMFFARMYINVQCYRESHVWQPSTPMGVELIYNIFLCSEMHEISRSAQKGQLANPPSPLEGWEINFSLKLLARNWMKCPDLYREIILPSPILIGIVIRWGSNSPKIVFEQKIQICTENLHSLTPTPHGSGMGSMYNLLLGII